MTNILVRISNGISDFFRGKTRIIRFSGRLNLDDQPREVINKVSEIYAVSDIKEYVLDLTQVEFIYPVTLIFFISIREFLETKGVELDIILTEGSPIHEYLLYCGFGDFFNLPEYPKDAPKTINPSNEVFRLQQGAQLGDTTRNAEALVDLLKIRQPLSPLVEGKAIDSIDEMLRNIKQHSGYTQHLLLGQAYPLSKRIRFSFYDNGVGIRSHLTLAEYATRHRRFKELISEELFRQMRESPANLAIEQAARYEVSGTNYTQNSGAGLDFLINKLSVPTEGTVSILSEDGFVQWKSGIKTHSFKIPFSFKGTLVSATINCDPESILVYSKEQGEK